MDLRIARVGKERSTLVGAPDGGHIGALGVGGEIVDVAVAAGAQDDRVGKVRGDGAGDQVAGDDAAGLAVDDDEVEHLRARVHGDGAGMDLAFERLVGAEQQLLAGLAAGVEGARDLGAAKGAVGERAAVFAGEGNALGYALIDDVDADLRQAIDVGLAGAEVAAFDGVVEEAVDAVAVVLVILGRVDAALRGDGVRAARRILKAEALHVVAELAQGGRSGGSRQAGSDDDDGVFALIRGVDQLDVETSLIPCLLDGPVGALESSFIISPAPVKRLSESRCSRGRSAER
jgi:hypothetical protein